MKRFPARLLRSVRPLLAWAALPAWAALLAWTALLAGCASTAAPRPKGVERENAAVHLQRAETEIAEGNLHEALGRLVALREVEGLPPTERARTEELLLQCAGQLFERLQEPEYDSDHLLQLFETELPPGLRARAGILAAEQMFLEGSRVTAYKQIKKVDRELPTHPERPFAGEVLARIGLDLIADPGRYYLFFKYRARGVDALEYLVVRYPLNPNCPRAYAELARYYEEKPDLDLAIERHEELLLYHPGSSLAAGSAARLPALRVERLEREDYDRRELMIARVEVSRWLGRYPGHELEDQVRALGQEVERLIAVNDMILARYYDRIRSPFGSRIHAERALRTAEDAGLEEVAAEARAFLAALPSEAGASWEVEVPAEDDGSGAGT